MKMDRFYSMTLPAAVVLSVFISCDNHPRAAQMLVPDKVQNESGAEPAKKGLPGEAQHPLTQLKLIRTGTMELEVTDFDAAAKGLARAAEGVGGYVAETESSRTPSGKRRGKLVLRIPSERFDATGNLVRNLGKLLSERSNVQDVTKAYAELETRIRVKQESKTRVQDILRTRTGKLQEVLEAERELTRIVEEIEAMEGERRYYDHQIQLSTLIVELQEPEALLQSSSWSSLGEAFRDSASLLSTSLAFLIRVCLVLLPWAIPVAGIWILIRRWKQKRQTKIES
jgi:hypothetical protein